MQSRTIADTKVLHWVAFIPASKSWSAEMKVRPDLAGYLELKTCQSGDVFRQGGDWEDSAVELPVQQPRRAQRVRGPVLLQRCRRCQSLLSGTSCATPEHDLAVMHAVKKQFASQNCNIMAQQDSLPICNWCGFHFLAGPDGGVHDKGDRGPATHAAQPHPVQAGRLIHGDHPFSLTCCSSSSVAQGRNKCSVAGHGVIQM